MAKPKVEVKTCTKCEDPAIEGQPYCKSHFAEYMRDYRARSDRKRDRANEFRGYEEGVKRCVELLRTQFGTHSVTGYQMAREIEKRLFNPEVPGMRERQALIASLRPAQ